MLAAVDISQVATLVLRYVLLPLVGLGALGVLLLCVWSVYQLLFGPFVVRQLITRYLRKRRIAWVSLIGVTLCTCMVLVVISVMAGWLANFKSKFRGMSGDIVVYRGSVTGFGGYEQMLEQINKLPEVSQAIPLIHTFGLLNISNQGSQAVQVHGVDLVQYSKFNQFRESLYRQYQVPIQEGKAPPATANYDLLPNMPYDAIRSNDPLANSRPGMIVSASVLGVPSDDKGKMVVGDGAFNLWCRLEVVPMSGTTVRLSDAQPAANIYWVVDVYRTRVSFLDTDSVYVPFDVLQRDLKMNTQVYDEVDADGKIVQHTRPARCSELQINIKPGTDREATIKKIDAIVQTISSEVEGARAIFSPIRVEPWEKPQERFLGAVENEKSLMSVLLGLISLVAIFLIFCILYMIVVEKTRDIGIIKSVGATSRDIAAVFIGYGMVIGVVGGLLGLGFGWLVMHFINELHSAVAWVIGKPIWDPAVYAFDKIPDKVDPTTGVIVVVVAIISAVIGAVVPAVRAARQNPIEALRYE